MTRDECIAELRSLRPLFEEHGINRVRLFGSFARDEADLDSDVDLLISFDRPLGLDFFKVERLAGEALGRRVEMCTEEAMHPMVKERALADAIIV